MPRASHPPTLGGVTIATWLRRDLRRPEAPTSSDERTFLTVVGLGVVVIAQLTEPGNAAQFALLLVAGVAFVLRAWWPRLTAEAFAALVIGPVAAVVGGGGVLELGQFLSVTMVLYVSWALGSLVRAIVITVVAAGLPVLVAWWWGPWGNVLWSPWVMAYGFLFVLGRAMHRQHELMAQLRTAQAVLAEQAVAEERRRIARELHDLAGHTLAAMLLHVTGARHVLQRDAADAARALADAEAVGRDGLAQIRATVGALRTTERGTDPALAAGTDLATLIDEYRRAGLSIDADLAPGVTALDGPAAVAVHRITREALANVARHAPTNQVVVRADRRADRVELRVADHGRAPDRASTNGFGLIGMRERARALGGDVTAAPTSDGWLVAAEVPVGDEGGNR